jgi:hypothetical protein
MLYLISFLSFLLPYQLGYHFNNFQNTVYGFRIDYLIPTLYITDIVATLLIVRWLYSYRVKLTKKYYILPVLSLGFVLLNIYNSLLIIPAIYKWIKVIEMILLGIVIYNTKKFDIYNNFLKPLSYSILIICLLGILQYFNKGSIGGIFYLLGERAYQINNSNIAPYPYSTFSHPNSFAGFLLVFGIFLIQFKKKFNKKYFWTLSFLVLINLILTNSLNIYITVSFLILLKLFKNNFSNLIFIDFSQRFVTHRLELIEASLKMIKSNFWLGVGINNFIPNLVKVSNTFLNAWELQPVHNIFLLVFSEIGIIGLFAFGCLVLAGLTTSSYGLIAVLFSGMSDHYWLTLQQNMLLFVYVLVISIKWKKNI